MSLSITPQRSEAEQPVASFTGEGAYHGSSKTKVRDERLSVPQEEAATVLDRYVQRADPAFADFAATFPNRYEVCRRLPVPTQEQVKADQVTFCWCPFAQALQEAGPLTRSVLQAMEPLLERKKAHAYVDAKIQYFAAGDLPVDSRLWHIDGSIAIRDGRARALGHELLHDLRTRLSGSVPPPSYLAYQSSFHCATEFAVAPVTVVIPDCLPAFDLLDERVRAADPVRVAQPAGSIVRFDGLSLHRAVPARDAGWRLWIRCVETDREVDVGSSVSRCYGTVFRPGLPLAAPPKPATSG